MSAIFLRVLKFSVFGSQSVTNLTSSRLKNRPARLKSPSKAVIEITRKQRVVVPVTACLPKQLIVLTRSACVSFKKQKKKQNHLKIITINSISGRTKPFFIELVCSNTNLTVTASVPKQQSINCLDEIGQRAITKKKILEHYKHNQRESKALVKRS